MLRTICCYTFGGLYLMVTYPLLLRARYLEKNSKLKELDRFVLSFTKKLSIFLYWLTGSSVKITGLDNVPIDQPVLFVSNHQSHMDSIIIQGYIDVPKGFVSIVEVLRFPILRTWMKYMKCVFLDRGDIKQMFTCIEESVKSLRQGHSMVIFPEGRFSECDTVGEFKKGCLKMAIKAGVPVVPITLKGSDKIMTKDGSRITGAAVECIISKPIQTVGLDKEEEKKLVEVVRDIIIKNI